MDSLIGIIPDEWAEKSLGEVCDILAGPSATKISSDAEPSSDNVPVVTPGDLRHNRITAGYTTSVPRGTADKLSRYRLLPDDIVCARTGYLDRYGIAGDRQQGWLIGPACLRLRAHHVISARYLVQYLGHPAVRDWITRNTSSSAIPTLSIAILGSLPVVIPPLAVQTFAAEILGALDDKIIVHEEVSRATAALRDAVLIPLLTGADPKQQLDGQLFS